MQPSSDAQRARIAAIVEQSRQRKAKEEAAAAAYQTALKRAHAIAEELLERTGAEVKLENDKLVIDASNGTRAEFGYDRTQISLVGRRFHAPANGRRQEGEVFFSYRIEKPKTPQGQSPGQWGPTVAQGVPAQQRIDSEQAFRNAIVDWFEWAHIGAGAPTA